MASLHITLDQSSSHYLSLTLELSNQFLESRQTRLQHQGILIQGRLQ